LADTVPSRVVGIYLVGCQIGEGLFLDQLRLKVQEFANFFCDSGDPIAHNQECAETYSQAEQL
jgi:hypothetical protein